MRLLSGLEGLCAIFVPFFIPVLVGRSGTLLVTEADSVLRENLNKVEKLVFDSCVLSALETITLLAIPKTKWIQFLSLSFQRPALSSSSRPLCRVVIDLYFR